MNVKNMLAPVTRIAYKVYGKTAKHAPEILLAGGLVSMVAGAIVACERTTKAEEIIDQAKKSIDTIHVETYNDAAAVLDELIAYLEQYGRVPVPAYYDAFDVSSDRDWTNVRWGWKSLREARVVPVRGGGYTLEMPSPEPL